MYRTSFAVRSAITATAELLVVLWDIGYVQLQMVIV